MEESSTDTIRNLSTKWSLAADEQLLNLLQNTHKKIISKCQDTSSKLEEMSLALDDACINLQNVNNKFMALSNTQFIESRVYDDDSETDGQTVVKEASTPSQMDELTIIKNSLLILDRVHEITEIVDDSDSDSDCEISVVLKPKDMYAHRPLPYIIGTTSWKNKWHAGLILEVSDSDSSTSQREEIQQYSDAESDDNMDKHIDDHTMSESGSSLISEQETTTKQHETTTKQQETTQQQQIIQSPADVAAELARRLAGPIQVIPQEPDDIVPPPVKKIYKPEGPVTSTIFSDEPPPLDEYDQRSSSEEDIFAEINKNKPYQQRNPTQSNLSEDLFGIKQTDKDIFSDLTQNVNQQNKKSTLFENSEPENDLFNKNEIKESQNKNIAENQESTSKKPIGGISLFGSNKGTESIGAAILRRNQRKSSSSDEQSENESSNQKVLEKPNIGPKVTEKPKVDTKITKNPNKISENVKNTDEVDRSNKEKDIFDNIFAKPKDKKPQKINKDVKKDIVKEQKNVKDLFSDNIFDDIDDIFTTNINIVKKDKEPKQKSIFDDDDLFSDIAEPKTVKQAVGDKKNIFDSDDDELFSDLKPKSTNNEEKINEIDIKTKNQVDTKNVSQINVEDSVVFDKNSQDIEKNIDKTQDAIRNKNIIKAKSIFDSDSDEDIFGSIKTPKTTENYNKSEANKNIVKNNNLIVEDKSVFQSPSLFDDDDDELFASSSKKDDKKLDIQENTDNNEVKINPDNIVKDNSKDEITSKKVGEEERDITCKNFDLDPIIEEKSDNHLDSQEEVIETLKQSQETKNNDDNLTEKSQQEIPKDVENERKSKIIISSDDDDDSFENSFEDSNENVSKVIESSENNVINDSNNYEIKANEQNQAKIDSKSDEIEANVDNQIKNERENIDIKEVVEENIFSATKSPNVFDDIFSEPPEFEKPSEPKKSKNVNALFDDDSDDETLFFKKNDVVTDEKPDLFTSNANFDIFVNEPPAIDIDFTPKDKILYEDDLFNTAIPENIKSPKNMDLSNVSNDDLPISKVDVKDNKPKEEKTIKIGSVDTKNDLVSPSDLFGEKLEKDLFKTGVKSTVQEKDTLFNENDESDDELFGISNKSSQNTENNAEKVKIPDYIEDSPKKDESKKIGKLNTKNFNINVNALIPGASPKKIPKDITETETQSKSVKHLDTDDSKNENVEVIENLNIKDKDYDTDLVLDNNVSKQRPRIQVKRRPSTRRARHEAARKSGIDFGNDNNSNIDENKVKTDPNKSNINDNLEKVTKNQKNYTEKENNSLEIDKNNAKEKANIEKVNENTDNISSSKKDNLKIDVNKSNINEVIKNDRNIQDSINTKSLDTTVLPKSEEKKSTTKIVYILNDEDIFNTNSTQNIDITNQEKIHEKNPKHDPVMETSNEKKANDKKSSLFEDSDEELFKTNKKTTKKVNIFESDSEDDLFAGKSMKEKQNKKEKSQDILKSRNKQQKVKESLFSDDDDDLFGVKIENNESKPVASTSKETKISTEPVFDDPLSILGED